MAKTLVKIDTNAVTARIMGEWKKALPLLTEVILADCNQYVKYREGGLLDSSSTATQFKEGIMRWQTPYAKRQYWEIETAVTTNGHPLARYKWVHYAKTQHQGKWVRQAAKLMGVDT